MFLAIPHQQGDHRIPAQPWRSVDFLPKQNGSQQGNQVCQAGYFDQAKRQL